MDTQDSSAQSSSNPDPVGAMDIDMRKIRTVLSLQAGMLVSETEARLWLVRAGFMPRVDNRWRAGNGSVDRLRELLN